jgi:probable HAF family extracellular repeat protein
MLRATGLLCAVAGTLLQSDARVFAQPVANFTGLGDLPGSTPHSEAYAVSSDGLVVVGYGTSVSGEQAFRWTAATGMAAIGEPAWRDIQKPRPRGIGDRLGRRGLGNQLG